MKIMSAADTRRFLGISRLTLMAHRRAGKIEAIHTPSGEIYSLASCLNWIERYSDAVIEHRRMLNRNQ